MLKPGGPQRFQQRAEISAAIMRDAGPIDVALLRATVEDIFADPAYHKRFREKFASRKTSSPLPLRADTPPIAIRPRKSPGARARGF